MQNIKKLFILLSLVFISFGTSFYAQNFLGTGLHTAPPMKLTNCCTEIITVNTAVLPAYSLFYRKQWQSKKYGELGLTTQGFNLKYERYDNSLEFGRPYIRYDIPVIGMMSIMAGMGKIFQFDNGHSFNLGAELSLRYDFSMGGIGIGRSDFALKSETSIPSSPIFLRPRAGYSWPFKLFRTIPFDLELYCKLSPQNLMKGEQWIRVNEDNLVDKSGTYSVNNSEIGVHFLLDISKEYYRIPVKQQTSAPKKKKKKIKRKSKVRLWNVREIDSES